MPGRLIAEHISKSFGPVRALDDVSIEFLPGEIHAVLGENGAGKSTFMNILSGFLSPDGGSVSLDGAELPLGRPHKCRDAGIEMVHQHFTLVPNFTVAENLALASVERLGGVLNVDRRAERAFAIAHDLGWEVDPKAKAGSLPVGVQQRVEILKCLAGNASVLIFDEPTAVLSPDEVLDLIRVLKRLRDEGNIVILIAHKLSEVMAAADRVTVLRGGRKVADALIKDVDEHQLANWMVGEMPEFQPRHSESSAKTVLSARDLSVRGDRGEQAVRNISFAAVEGEILGIGGVDGNGQVELAEALALIRYSSGSLLWNGSPISAADVRIAYIPHDRQVDGLALSMSVEENLLIGDETDKELNKGLFLWWQKIHERTQSLIRRYEIKVSSPDQAVESLSGGNQQKIVVSRNLYRRPDLIVVVNPTRGLDVRATQYVREQILSAGAARTTVIYFSTDLDELAIVADRILFMSRGELLESYTSEALVGGSRD